MRAPARSTTWWRARRRRSRGRGGFSPICRRRCTSCRARIDADRRPGAARAVADRGGAARPAQGLRHAPHPAGGRRHGLAVRDGPQVRRLGHHRRWRGSTAGRSRCWRAIRTSTAAAGPRMPRRRSRASSISPTRSTCRSCIWSTCRASSSASRPRRPARSATARARSPRSIRQACRGARSSSARCSASRAPGHTPHHAAALSLRLAVGRLGLAAGRGRHRGGLSRRARRGAGPRQAAHEIEERLNRYRSPFRTAETFLVEEIIDPRDTRPLLCEFANLAAKLREPGPVATPMRP